MIDCRAQLAAPVEQRDAAGGAIATDTGSADALVSRQGWGLDGEKHGRARPYGVKIGRIGPPQNPG